MARRAPLAAVRASADVARSSRSMTRRLHAQTHTSGRRWVRRRCSGTGRPGGGSWPCHAQILATTVPGVVAALRERVDGEVRFDDGSRAAYSTDASNFRQVPIGVVVPRTIEAAVEAVAVCREHDLPIVNRGGGTSLAGQCTNEAVVLDLTKYCHRVVSVDAERRRCVVEPGIVLDVLNRHLAPTGLRFGPEPATHQNCTLGGMIGNNSCGATAQRTGKVVDNIASLEVLLYDGTRFTARRTDDDEYDVDRAARATGARRSTGPCVGLRDEHARPDPRALSRHPAPGVRLQPRLAAARARLRPGRASSSAASPRWSRCCTPSWSWCRSSRSAPWSCWASPTSPTAADAVPDDRRARADRPRGRRPLPDPRRAAQGHEPRRRWRSCRRAPAT